MRLWIKYLQNVATVRTFYCTFEDICHLADVVEGGAITPGVDHVHHGRLERVNVRVLFYLQLRLLADAGNTPGRVLSYTPNSPFLTIVLSLSRYFIFFTIRSSISNFLYILRFKFRI